MYPHYIRLRGPWEWEPANATSPRRVTLPCRWADLGLDGSVQRVRLHRRFGLPRQLDPHERIWLQFHGAGDVRAWLNGKSLGGGAEFDVTTCLEARNHLQVELDVPAEDGPLWEEVLLEIRCLASLRDVIVRAEPAGDNPRLHVAGVVAGTADQALDVYLLVENRTAGYATVAAGAAFTLVSDPLSTTPATVRIELVRGAVVWHTLNLPLAPSARAGSAPRGRSGLVEES